MNLPRHLYIPLLLFVTIICSNTAYSQFATDSVNDLKIIKQRLYNRYLKNSSGSKEPVSMLLKTLQPDGSWKDYNYDERPKLGLAAIGHLHRLVAMCNAYRSADSTLYDDKALKEKIHLALNFWYTKDPETEHHWFNEIGAPREMVKILIFLENELSADELTKGVRIVKKANVNGVLMYGKSKATGQNMIWIARLQAEAGCLQNNPGYVKFSIGEIEKEISVTTAEGIQPDWSFHQHGPQLYSGGYGLSFIRDCAEFATITDNTNYQLGHEEVDILSHLILDGHQWMTRGHTMDYGTMGREIARTDKDAGAIATACDDMASINTNRRQEFMDLSNRIKGLLPIDEGLSGNRHFWRSDFMVHQRPTYYTSVKMVSNRVFGSETGNGEANFNYHVPDGCTYLIKTGEEYKNIFPLWDWRKIPGVTCRQNNTPLPLMTFGQNSSGKTSFVGGVSNGKYGMAAFDYDKDSVQAHKAWFYFDKEYVCLGTGISSETADIVTTTINQCFSKGAITVSNKATTNKIVDKTTSFKGSGWVHHDGTAYLFPHPANVQLRVQSRSADWQVINTFRSGTRTETGKIFTLWIDHGAKPVNASYSYIVIPEIDKNKVAGEAARKNITILFNTSRLQAVKNKALGLVQAAFYVAGKLVIDDATSLEVDQPCLLQFTHMPTATGITLSNPENKVLTVHVKLIRKGAGNIEVVYQLPDGEFAGQSVTQYFPD